MGAAVLLSLAFVVSLTGFRRPPGWVGVTQRLSFASDVPRPTFEEASVDEQGWPIDTTPAGRDELLQHADALRRHVSGQLSSQWHHSPRSERGSFIRESWCRPAVGSTSCLDSFDSATRRTAREWYQLDLVRADAPSRQLAGYVFSARSFAAIEGAPSNQLKLARGGGRVVRPGLLVEHTRQSSPEESIRFGTSYEIRAGGLHCVMYVPGYRPQSVNADRATFEELARLVESPTSLRDTVSTRLNTLLERAESALISDIEHDDICTVELDASQDREALREVLHQTIDRRLEVVSENAAAIHEWLSSAVPTEEIGTSLH